MLAISVGVGMATHGSQLLFGDALRQLLMIYTYCAVSIYNLHSMAATYDVLHHHTASIFEDGIPQYNDPLYPCYPTCFSLPCSFFISGVGSVPNVNT